MGAEPAEERHSQSPQGDTPGAAPRTATADIPLRPDVALGLWMSWMETNFGKAPGLDGHRQALVAGDAGRSRRQHAGGRQHASSTRSWRATRCCARSTRCGTPTRCARSIPVDWAEIARALRTVWMRSLARPGASLRSAAELNAKLWQTAITNLEPGGPALVGPCRAQVPRRCGRRVATSASRLLNGTRTRSTGPLRRCTCWPRTG